MVDLATKVRVGTAAEWLDVYQQGLEYSKDQAFSAPFTMGDAFASGTTAGGLAWAARLSQDASAVSVEVTSPSAAVVDGGMWAWYSRVDDPHIDLATTPSTTYAVAVASQGASAPMAMSTGLNGWSMAP